LRNDRHKVFHSTKILPNLDIFYSQFVHIPCGWWLSLEDINFIIDVIKRGW
jgi:hypothetical protein